MHLRLGGDLGLGVRDLDSQFLCAGNDVNSLSCRHCVCDPAIKLVPVYPLCIPECRDVLGGVCAVVHEKKVNFADVVDEESLVAGGHHMAGLLVGTVTDLRGVRQNLSSSPSRAFSRPESPFADSAFI